MAVPAASTKSDREIRETSIAESSLFYAGGDVLAAKSNVVMATSVIAVVSVDSQGEESGCQQNDEGRYGLHWWLFVREWGCINDSVGGNGAGDGGE